MGTTTRAGALTSLDCHIVVAFSGGIASMVVMTGATAWIGALSGGIASMVAMIGAIAAEHPCVVVPALTTEEPHASQP